MGVLTTRHSHSLRLASVPGPRSRQPAGRPQAVFRVSTSTQSRRRCAGGHDGYWRASVVIVATAGLLLRECARIAPPYARQRWRRWPMGSRRPTVDAGFGACGRPLRRHGSRLRRARADAWRRAPTAWDRFADRVQHPLAVPVLAVHRPPSPRSGTGQWRVRILEAVRGTPPRRRAAASSPRPGTRLAAGRRRSAPRLVPGPAAPGRAPLVSPPTLTRRPRNPVAHQSDPACAQFNSRAVSCRSSARWRFLRSSRAGARPRGATSTATDGVGPSTNPSTSASEAVSKSS
jgi:hypothetical protein